MWVASASRGVILRPLFSTPQGQNGLIGCNDAGDVPGQEPKRNGVRDFSLFVIALFNPGTHQTAIWYLSGVTFVGGAYGPTLPSAWALVAIGDFSFDCDPDYVLYNPSTHQTAVRYMHNNAFASGVFGPTLPAGWRLAGATDFNADGFADYLLFNPSTRQSAIWYLDGARSSEASMVRRLQAAMS